MAAFSFLDLIFPKKCLGCGKLGSYICGNCIKEIEIVEHPICPECERQAIGGKTHPGCLKRFGLDGLVVACRYKGVVRAAIKEIKYKWSYDVSRVLVDLLVANLWRFNFPQKAILVPIPLHVRRKNWRGFNQAELICQILAKNFKVSWQNTLIRTRETRTQVGLSQNDRLINIKGAFRTAGVEPQSGLKGKNVILVDDVFTTGATMFEACNTLKRAGARSVWAMVIAKD